MLESVEARQGRSNTVSERLDLVRLALELIGNHQIEEVLGSALRWLSALHSSATWAILLKAGPERYETAVHGRAGLADLRRLADDACGARSWISLGKPYGRRSRLGPAAWFAYPASACRDSPPDLVIACWERDGWCRSLEARQFELAGQMIASAAASARTFASLHDQSYRDSLTALLNRRAIMELLQRERARAKRGALPLSVIFFDIDSFKMVNDRHGHSIGDEVLCAASGVLACALRSSDAVGRLGGDEFLAVLPDTDLSLARKIARRLVKKVGSTPIHTSVGVLGISLTHGVASIDEDSGEDGLIERADRRMLEQKRLRLGDEALAAMTESSTPSRPSLAQR